MWARDVSIYKPLTYQDPSRDSAFPYNLPDVAEVFLLKVQGSSAVIENNCADIPDDFTEILAGLLADKALDRLERGLGMEMYQTDQGDFERKYGTYLSQARRTLNGRHPVCLPNFPWPYGLLSPAAVQRHRKNRRSAYLPRDCGRSGLCKHLSA